MCRSAREKPYLRAAPSEYRVDTANGQDNDDAQTRTGELWASYALLGESGSRGYRTKLAPVRNRAIMIGQVERA